MAAEQLKIHFIFSETDNNRTNGFCMLCQKNYKDKTGIYSNFTKHLRRKHKEEYDELFNSDDEDLTESNVNRVDYPTTTEPTSDKVKQNRFNMSIARYLIVKCNLPLSIAENSGFRQFMKDCNCKWTPISSKKLKFDYIAQLTEQMKQNVNQVLNEAKYITLTVDGWSDRKNRSFIGVTCHFINQKCEPKAFLIDFVRFKSPHTGDNIYRITESILDHYNIKDKVFKIITDNASTMIKAFKFGLLVNDEINDDNDNDDYQIPLHFDTNTILHNVSQHIADHDLEFMDIQYNNDDEDNDNPADIRLSCFIHSLQLCVRDGLKNASYVPKLLKKCQDVARFSHKSLKVADLLEDLNKRISKMNVTRWNSEFLFIKSIFSIRDDLEQITSLMDNPVKFSKNDFTVLEEMIDILEPFHDISIKCQAETAVTASLVVPSVVHLISHLRDIKPSISLCIKLVQQLETSMQLRFSGIINRLALVDGIDNSAFGDPVYFIAAVLDPSFKLFWVLDLKLSTQMEQRLKQHIIDLIINEMKKDLSMSTAKSTNIANSSVASSSCSTPLRKKRRILFNYDENVTNDINDSSTLDPAVQLDAYLNDL
ncbi:unnamed protein product, partial [Adineta steineri]